MPFDLKLYYMAAQKKDVAGIALDTAICLQSLRDAVEKIAAKVGVDVQEELITLDRELLSLDKRYVELTGWKSEES
jgi:hypothetical protein